MAQTWTAKAAADVVERQWDVGKPVSTVSATGTGVTVNGTDIYDDIALVTLSAGTAGTTGTVAVTAVTSEGETLTETFYIAIRATTAQLSNTARDVCIFAMRKITGNGQSPEADELDDTLERLNDMIALWALNGVDIGLSAPLTANTTLSLPDGYLAALKFNLRVACHSHYDAAIDAYDAGMADKTYRALETALLDLGDVAMPYTLRRRANDVADLF